MVKTKKVLRQVSLHFLCQINVEAKKKENEVLPSKNGIPGIVPYGKSGPVPNSKEQIFLWNSFYKKQKIRNPL